MLEVIAHQPTIYMDELQDYLQEVFEVLPSITTLWRTLRRHNLTRKIVDKHVKERSEALRVVWRARQRLWRPEQVVAVDESACNERTMDRKRGWSFCNTSCVSHYSAIRSKRWSILPAMSVDGYMAYRVLQGSITSEIFEDFLEQDVLPQCTPYPGPRSIIVIDNASIHRSERVKELCAAAGVVLEFLPPYSPDYNPIEQSFRAMKAWMHKHCSEYVVHDNMPLFIEGAIQGVCLRPSYGYFKRCGYMNWD